MTIPGNARAHERFHTDPAYWDLGARRHAAFGPKCMRSSLQPQAAAFPQNPGSRDRRFSHSAGGTSLRVLIELMCTLPPRATAAAHRAPNAAAALAVAAIDVAADFSAAVTTAYLSAASISAASISSGS